MKRCDTPESLDHLCVGDECLELGHKAMGYLSAAHELDWVLAVGDASTLEAQLTTYQSLFVAFMERASVAISSARCTDSGRVGLMGAVSTACQVLHVLRADWPPFRKVTPALLTALSHLAASCSVWGVASSNSVHAEIYIQGLVQCLNTLDMRDRFVLADIPETLVRDLLTALTKTHHRFCTDSCHPVPRQLLLLLVFRHNLMHFGVRVAAAHVQRILTTSKAASMHAARLAIICLARSEPLVDEDDAKSDDLTYSLLDQAAEVERWEGPIHRAGYMRQAAFVNSLRTISERYPNTLWGCGVIMYKMLNFEHGRDFMIGEAALFHSIIYSCIQPANRLFQKKPPQSTAPLGPQQSTLAECMVQLHRHKHTLPQPPAVVRLIREMCHPGFLSTLEAYARGPPPLNTKGFSTRILSIYQFLDATDGLSFYSSPEARLKNQMIRLSAVTTAHKLIIDTVRVRGYHTEDRLVWMAECMSRVMAREFLHAPHRPHARQMYLLVGASLQALLHKLVVTDIVQGVQTQIQGLISVYPAPDFHTHPEMFAACAEGCFTSFKGIRLLPNCSNPGCENMAGAMDAALRTPFLCGGCRRARYCSEKCSKADWVTWGHGKVCGKGAWSLPAVFTAFVTAEKELDAARAGYTAALQEKTVAALKALTAAEAAYSVAVAVKRVFDDNVVIAAKAAAVAGLPGV